MEFTTLLTSYWYSSRRSLCLLLLVWWSMSLASRAYAQQVPGYQWAKAATGSDLQTSHDVGTDAMGNAYITGVFWGSATFTTTTLTSRGNSDVYLAKYNSQGQLLWVQQLGGVGKDEIEDLAVDAAGNAYVVGSFGPDFSGSPPYPTVAITIGSTTLSAGNNNSTQLFLAKYDPQGSVLWTKNTLGNGTSTGYNVVKLDHSGNAYLLGALADGCSIDQFSFTNGLLLNYFIAKFNSQGVRQWIKGGFEYGGGEFRNLAVDATDNLFVVGLLTSAFQAGTSTITPQLATPSYFAGEELYLVKLDAQGQTLGGQYFAFTAYQPLIMNSSISHTYGSLALAVNAQGDLVCARTFMGSTTLDGQPFVSKGDTDIVLLACSTQGAYKWSVQLGGPGPDRVDGLAVDTAGDCYLGISLTGMTTLTQYTGVSNSYCYFASFAPNGTMRWVRPTGAILFDIAALSTDEVWVTGYFNYTQRFDNFNLTATGSYNAFLARLTAAAPAPTPTPTPTPTTPTPPLVAIIPNIITPNADGLNDTFQPINLSAGPWQLHIYSRWGRLVYQTDDYHQDWNAPGLPDGLYYYYMELPTQRTTVKGWVEVIH